MKQYEEIEKKSKGVIASIEKDIETDYAESRDNIKDLINETRDTISELRSLAQDLQHPRAYEVLGGLFKTAAELIDSLIRLQTDRKKIHGLEKAQIVSPIQVNTNKAAFVGTTADLQNHLENG